MLAGAELDFAADEEDDEGEESDLAAGASDLAAPSDFVSDFPFDPFDEDEPARLSVR